MVLLRVAIIMALGLCSIVSMADIECIEKDGSSVSCGASFVAPLPMQTGVAKEAEKPRTMTATIGKGYTLQLAALDTEDAAMAFVANLAAGDLDGFQIFRTITKGRAWNIVTWGRFSTAREAAKAWADHQKDYPNIKPWVRSINTLVRNAISASR